MPNEKLLTLFDFENVYGNEFMDGILRQKLIEQEDEARKFRAIENVIFDDDVTIDIIRDIVRHGLD